MVQSDALRGGVNRRQFVEGLGFGMLGLGLPDVLARQAMAAAPRKAKSCIMLFLFGGPSHVDTWDMKPQAPKEFRGEFQPIATSVPGIDLCEHLPLTSRVTQHLSIVRSVTMAGRVIGNGDHHADTFYMLTGHQPDRSFFLEGINRKPHADDWPFVGSAAASRLPQSDELPHVVQLPALSGEVTGYINPGQFSGRLGPQYEPVLVRGDLERPRELSVPQFLLPPEIAGARMDRRRGLLAGLEDWQRTIERPGGPIDRYTTYQQRAFSLITSERSKQAFDISQEPASVRERYGNEINAQSVLMARRLVEAGVPFVCVHWIGRRVGAGLSWDTHSDNFGQLRNTLLPPFDACYSALINDLAERGLLDETLVVVNAEMGRTPKVGDPRAGGAAGRDHWVNCQSTLFAGGGIAGGRVYGASDEEGGYPATRPVHPEDIAATVYESLGIREQLVVQDRLQLRPINLLEEGEALPLFG